MIRPFEEVIIECRLKGFDALGLIRQLQTFSSKEIESLASHTDLAWLASKCNESKNSYHEFCDFWIHKSPSAITVVLRAARKAGDDELEKAIRKVMDDILNNKQCYHDELPNIELFEKEWKAFIADLPHNEPVPDENPSAEILTADEFSVTDPERKSIFISYTWACRPDDVHKLANKLERRFNVWLDKNNIRGDDINAAMAKGIENCDLVVVCFSEAYKTRPNCYKELSYAERCQKPIALVTLHPNIEERGPCWMILQYRQYVQFYNIGMLQQTTEELTKVIESLLRLQEKPFINRPAPAERFLPRKPLIFDAIMQGLQKVCLTPNLGAVAVVGAAGVGKTTMVSHILDEFKSTAPIDGVLWTSCKQWNDEKVFQSRDVVNNIIGALSVALRRRNVTELSAFSDKRFIFVFDEIFNAKILEIIRHEIVEKNIPLVLLFRSNDFLSFGQRSTQGWLIDTVNIGFFTDAEMRAFLLDTWELQGKVSDSVIRDNISKFNGDPGLATIWAQHDAYFEYGSIFEKSAIQKNTDLLISGAPRFEKYYARTDDEKAIKEMLCLTAQDPTKGIAVVLGGGGNGKSTVMSNIIYSAENQRFFLDQIGVSAIFWLNCYQWNKAMTESDRTSFVQKLLELGRSCLDDDKEQQSAREWRFVRNMVRYFQNRFHKGCLFILDDCFNAQILTVFRNEAIGSPCCVISRYQETLGTAVDFTQIVQIQGLCEAAILEMLQTTHRLKDALSADKLMHLAKMSGGSPLVASLIAGQLNSGRNKEKAYKKLCDEGLLKLAHKSLTHSQKDDEQTAYALFSQAMKMMDDEQKERYFSFLLYDPVEPVTGKDIAMFWGISEADALDTFEFFESVGLATRISKRFGNAFQIHQILHEALLEKFKSELKVTDLWQARIAIFNQQCPVHAKQSNLATKMVHTMNKLFILHCDDFLLNFIAKASHGDFSEMAVEHDANIRLVDVQRSHDRYPTLIHMALYNSGKIEVVKYLAELCPEAVKVQNEYGETALHKAAESGEIEVVKVLAELCPEAVKVQNKYGETALHRAAYNGKMEAVKYLAELNPKTVNVHNKYGNTALHMAAESGKIEVVKFLAELCPEAGKVQNTNGETALHRATYNGKMEVVKVLAELNPETVKVRNKYGNTALHNAAGSGEIEVVKYLAELCPEAVNVREKYDETALHNAAGSGEIEVVKYLAELSPEAVKVRDKYGATALHKAAYDGKMEVVRYFSKRCPEAVKVQDNSGETALLQAAGRGEIEVVKYLAELCPEAVKVQNKYGETALHRAAYNGKMEVVKYLAELCPEAVKVQNEFGETALHKAAGRGEIEVVKYLAELCPEAVPEPVLKHLLD